MDELEFGLFIIIIFSCYYVYIIVANVHKLNPKIDLSIPRNLINNEKKEKKDNNLNGVVGLNSTKKELEKYIDMIKNKDKYLKYNVKLPKGILLIGPPGCGKTLLAKTIASQTNMNFLYASGSEFIEMYVGVGASRVRKLFNQAKSMSNCLIFIDEIDAIGRKRNENSNNSERDNTLNQLLVEMDGFKESDNIIVLAATNLVDVLDPALLRSGRFDKKVYFDPPNEEERKEIFKLNLDEIEMDYQWLSERTAGLNGADIANICNLAKINSLMKYNELKLDKEIMEDTIDEVMIGMEKPERKMTLEEREIVSVHEAGHAIIGYLLENTSAPIKVSIMPRGQNALGFSQPKPIDKKLYTLEELLSRICELLGGRLAEEIIYQKITTGGSDDIEKISNLINQIVLNYGMIEKLGYLNHKKIENSSKKKEEINEINNLIYQHCYKETKRILEENKDLIIKTSKFLLEKETLLNTDLEELIGKDKKNSVKLNKLSS